MKDKDCHKTRIARNTILVLSNDLRDSDHVVSRRGKVGGGRFINVLR